MYENRFINPHFVSLDSIRMARYVMITPNPEDDVIIYMNAWAKKSGLLDFPDYKPRAIGWDFPFVPHDLYEKFGLRGYVYAYVIPDDFTPKCQGAEIVVQPAASYGMITVENPFEAPFEIIPAAYKALMGYIEEHGTLKEDWCFEETYEKDGITYMDIYITGEAK